MAENKVYDELQCLSCIHFLSFDKEINKTICIAFIEGIPKKILSGEFDHIKKYPGQKNDLVWTEIED